MLRKNVYQQKCSLVAYRNLEKAENSRLLILRKAGPLSYVLKEENKDKNFKVNIGEDHSCNCDNFLKLKDLCIHICWILIRIFKLSKDNPVSWQHGFTNHQIEDITLNRNDSIVKNEVKQEEIIMSGKLIKRRMINESTDCPVCLENILSKHQPVTYCKIGCGNAIHLSCMLQLAIHQHKKEDGIIKCPMCRSSFDDLLTIKKQLNNFNLTETRAILQKKHSGYICDNCNIFPIIGTCFQCSKCENVYFCRECSNKNQHICHNLYYREKVNSKWKSVNTDEALINMKSIECSLYQRELLTPKYIALIPESRILHGSNLLNEGLQCCLCFEEFKEGDIVRILPCLDVFHKTCADEWLSMKLASCPLHQNLYLSKKYISKIANALRNKRCKKAIIKSEENTKMFQDFQVVGVSMSNPNNKINSDSELQNLPSPETSEYLTQIRKKSGFLALDNMNKTCEATYDAKSSKIKLNNSSKQRLERRLNWKLNM